MFFPSSLASVSPPNIWYRLQLPQDVADNAHLSALQLEAVVYACQKHETFLPNGNRAGFLIGKKLCINVINLVGHLSFLVYTDSHLYGEINLQAVKIIVNTFMFEIFRCAENPEKPLTDFSLMSINCTINF